MDWKGRELHVSRPVLHAKQVYLRPQGPNPSALACQCMFVDQATDGGLEEKGDGPGMNRAILVAQRHGQLDQRRLHSDSFTWSLKEMV